MVVNTLEINAMAEPELTKKPIIELSQILLVAMAPMMVVVAIPLNVFLGQAIAWTFVTIAVPMIIVAVLLLSSAEKKRWAARE